MNPLGKMKTKPGYRWVIVGVSALMVFVTLGFGSGPKNLYLSVITEALGLRRALFSINDSVRFVATAIVNLFFGAMIARLGPRKMIAMGFMCLIGSMLLYSVAEGIFVFYLGGALLGIGLSWTTTAMVGHVVGLWCSENKGTIMGAILAANGLGNMLAVQILSPLINANLFGYRTAYRVTAVIMAVVGVVVLLLFKDAPEHAVVSAPGKKKPKRSGWNGLSLKEYMKLPWFYLVLLCVFLTGMILQGSAGVFPAHMKDVGLNPDYVTTVVSVYSLALTCSKFLCGAAYDRLGLRITMLICNIAAVAMAVMLAMLTGSTQTLAMASGVVLAVSLPLETIMLPLIAADLFGDQDSARVLGILVAANTTGYAVGVPLSNLFFDWQGTYQNILLIMGGVMVAVALLIQYAIGASRKLRKNIGE